MTFLFAIKLSSDFYKGSNICKLCDNYMLQFFVLFVTLTRMVAILSVVKNNSYKKGIKKNMYSFEIKSEMCKTSILWLGIVYLM